ncbi:hypothetical protein QTA57_18195 [Fontisubflavum oceani]|uniref:hypothetical protein n=1 Tax=Fontisubflavum oceani TaxID=2978973 RepID=UPI0025B61394|nr:hypothetical protein [Fontisubflavum oceani]WJY21627.1 hypothetical protein QTA57_18195 [Fontisubflavum oceani]
MVKLTDIMVLAERGSSKTDPVAVVIRGLSRQGHGDRAWLSRLACVFNALYVGTGPAETKGYAA